MNAKHGIALFLTVFALPLSAQNTKPPKTDKPAAPIAKPAEAAVKPAAMHTVAVPVTGLSAEADAKAKSALTALTRKEWTCPKCHSMQAHAGTCKVDDVALVETKAPAFQTVDVVPGADPTAGMLKFELARGSEVSLKQIEKTLAASGVKVSRPAIALRGMVEVILEGAASKADADSVSKALESAKIAGKAAFDESKKEVVLRVSDADTTYEQLGNVVRKAAPALRMGDVVFRGQGSK